jgi:hypothetical protein
VHTNIGAVVKVDEAEMYVQSLLAPGFDMVWSVEGWWRYERTRKMIE